MSVLVGEEILRRIYCEPDPTKRLTITPLLDPNGQIQRRSCSVDLRLGPHFLVHRRSNVSFLDPGERSVYSQRNQMEEKIFTPFDKFFVLHPNQFALGATLEYVSFPSDLSGYVVTRSSWGRLGLITATAIGIHPGFKGVITLELRNVGEVPIYLRPGLTLVQVFFHMVYGALDEADLVTPYIGAVTPESSRLGPTPELSKIQNLGLGAVPSYSSISGLNSNEGRPEI